MVTLLLLYIVIFPICLLLHEVGHGIGVVLSSKSHAWIYLGNLDEDRKSNFSIGKLHFHIHWAYFGFCSWDDSLNKRQKIFALAGGPVMSLLLACLFILFMKVIYHTDFRPIINGIIIFNIAAFFTAALPIRYPRWFGPLSGHPSDGLQLLHLLKSR